MVIDDEKVKNMVIRFFQDEKTLDSLKEYFKLYFKDLDVPCLLYLGCHNMGGVLSIDYKFGYDLHCIFSVIYLKDGNYIKYEGENAVKFLTPLLLFYDNLQEKDFKVKNEIEEITKKVLDFIK